MRRILPAVFTIAVSLFTFSVNGQTLPSTYTQTTIVSALSYPVDFDWSPDGRYFITQKGGYSGTAANAKILVYSSAGTLLSTFADVTDSVTCGGERGLLGIAVDPNFATNHFVYAYYVYKYGTSNQIRVVRWLENANVGTNPTTILSLNLNTLGFTPQPYHYAGMIRFRPSQPDKLYICVGEMYHNQQDTTAGANFGQMLNKPYGKILRINTDGTIPTDNPFYDDGNPATGKDDRIWSYGHRNMFGMCVNPVTDSLYEAENGLTTWDEFNIIHKGGNYGWNHCEGLYENSSTTVLCTEPGMVAPLSTWGAPLPALTGCLFYSGTAMPEFNNHILVADNDYGRLYDLTMGNAPAYDVVMSKTTFADVVNVGSVATGLTTIRQGNDGCIYGMIGGYTTAGSIFRICHTSGTGIASNEKQTNLMQQNFPNPASDETQINYTVSDDSDVLLELFDVTGRKIKTILNSQVVPGDHSVTISGLDKFAPGSYFYKIEVKQNGKVAYNATRRMMIIE